MTETFGEALRRLRVEQGLSLRALQASMRYSHGYISELERGLKKPTLPFAQRIDQVLNANGLLTALASAAKVAPMVEATTARDDGDDHFPFEEFAMTADESAQFIRRAGTAPTPELIDQLASEVRALAVQFLRQPPYAIFQPIAAHRREVFGMLDGHVRPEHLADLYLIAGQLTALLAHASADLGQPFAAEAHARTAWMCADLASHNPLRAYVRWVQSNIAYWTGDYPAAANIAYQGQQFATSGSSLLRLTSQQARAWAAAGDHHAVQHALDDAQNARDNLIPDHAEVGVFWFSAGKSAYYASEAWAALGTAEAAQHAISDAEEAIQLLNAEPHPTAELVAAAHLDLSAAHLAADDLSAAHAKLPSVLDLPTDRRTVPLVERAIKIGQTLGEARFIESPMSRELRERISLFAAYPATKQLTA